MKIFILAKIIVEGYHNRYYCNDLFSRFEQQILFLEKQAETMEPTTERHGHDGTSWARRTVEGVLSQNT